VLKYDLNIAGTVKFLGWLGMTLAVAWVAWRWWSDRKRPELAETF
jgi:hypothetical protein